GGGEPAGAAEAPPVGDGGDGEPAAGAGPHQILAGAVEPDPPEVLHRGDAHVSLEGELDGADGDGRGGGDVGDGDVEMSVLVNERDRPAQGDGMGIVPVLDGG